MGRLFWLKWRWQADYCLLPSLPFLLSLFLVLLPFDRVLPYLHDAVCSLPKRPAGCRGGEEYTWIRKEGEGLLMGGL